MAMTYAGNIDPVSLGLVKEGSWAFWGAKHLTEIIGLSVNVIENLESPVGIDVLMVPRVSKADEDILIHFVHGGGTLLTEGGIADTEFERLLDISEQRLITKDEVIVLHSPEGDISLPALIEYIHKGNPALNDSGRFYQVNGDRYIFDAVRNIGKGKVILLSSLFTLICKTYSWTSKLICNQNLINQPYVDILANIFLEVIVREADGRNKILPRLWYYPSFQDEAAMLVTFDIDDRYSYLHTLKRRPYEKCRKLAFNLICLPLSKFVSMLRPITDRRLSTKSRETTSISLLIQVWKKVNTLVTPNFLRLVERGSYKAVLFLRPPIIQAQEKGDKACYRLESYQIFNHEVQEISGIHEIGLHFGKSLITVKDAQARETKSYWTDKIQDQLIDLEKAAGIKIYGSRGHSSLYYYPDTPEHIERAGIQWDSTYYGQQRWISPDGETIELGYNGFSTSWMASIVGTSLPFWPVVSRQESSLRELATLEISTTLYEPRNGMKAALSSIEGVLRHHGVINIQCHPIDVVTYIELRRILAYLEGRTVWKTAGKALSTWWRQRREVEIHSTTLKVANNEIYIDSHIDTRLDILSLVVHIPRSIDISGIQKLNSHTLNILEYDIDRAMSVVKLDVQCSVPSNGGKETEVPL